MSVQGSELEGFDLQAPWTLESTPLATAHQRGLRCDVAGTAFAVPIGYLRGVEPFAVLTPLPHVAPWVVGLTNVRGTVVGVVDLARFLGLGETTPGAGRLLICGAGPRLVALAVSDARDVLDYPASAVVETTMTGRAGRYVAGLIQTDRTAVPLLDVGRLLADDELVRG